MMSFVYQGRCRGEQHAADQSLSGKYTQVGPMTGVKGKSMSASPLKTSGMLGWLEHDEEETRKLCLGVDCGLCLGRRIVYSRD